ncbi:MAG: phosphatidylserine decarboxylase [Pseudomonadota bacterium]|nr:MAG: phosphatidylserine decarboxylase [Pseudomonadota bacterium]
MMPALTDRLVAWPQYLLPHKLLTAMAWFLSTCRIGWMYRPFVRLFVRLYGVNLGEAERRNPDDYTCFNDFFTRALKRGARPLADSRHRLISPCDGTISQRGRLDGSTLVQAKGQHYTATALLGDEQRAAAFTDGHFITIYLAPGDYHRVHAPISGQVVEEVRIPGRLFSVSDTTARVIPGLYTRNERMVTMLETDHGPVAVVMVAAMLVSGIETVWGGLGDRRPGRKVRVRRINGLALRRGDELGRFHWGSTVILLVPGSFPSWRDDLHTGQRILTGQSLTGREDRSVLHNGD